MTYFNIFAIFLISGGFLLIVFTLAASVKKSAGPERTAIDAPPNEAEIVPPDMFNGARIQDDLRTLAALQDANLFRRYKTRLKIKFTKREELDLIDSWIHYYEKGKQLVETKTALQTALTDHSRQQHIKTKEQERELANLNADIHEADLRAEEAKVKKENLRKPKQSETPALKPHEEERLRAQSILEENVKHDIYKQLQAKIFSLDELLKLKDRLIEQTLALKLPPDQTQARIDLVYRIYEQEKRKIMGEDDDVSPYEKG